MAVKKTLSDYIERANFPFNYEGQLFNQHGDFLRDIMSGKVVPPLHFEFLPTERCNHHCVWCVGGDREDMANKNELPEEDMIKVIEELSDYGVEGIVRFSGMSGEPLVNKGTLPAIRRGVDLGLNLGLITNGILLNERAHDFLSGSTYVSVSLDAGSMETMNKLKGHNDNTFERIVANIAGLADFKRRNKEKFRLTVGYLLHPGNYKEIVKATSIVKDTGADIIQFKVPFGNGIKPFTKDKVKKVYELIQAAKQYDDAGFKVVPMQTVTEQEKELVGQLPEPCFSKCYAQFINSVVGADGNVYSCVHYYYNQRVSDVSGEPIGNIHNQSFKEIWESDKRKRLIEGIDPSKHCNRCNRYDHRANLFINFLVEHEDIPE